MAQPRLRLSYLALLFVLAPSAQAYDAYLAAEAKPAAQATPATLWGQNPAAAGSRLMKAREAAHFSARAHLEKYAARLKLSGVGLDTLTPDKTLIQPGGAQVVEFRQRFGAIEVYQHRLSVVMTPDGDLVSIHGGVSPYPPQSGFVLDVEAAADRLWQDLGLRPPTLATAGRDEAGFSVYIPDSASLASQGWDATQPLRVKPVYYRMPDRLVPAWQFELALSHRDAVDAIARRYLVNAVTGEILVRDDLRHRDAYRYGVFADPQTLYPLDGPQGRQGTPYPAASPSRFQPVYQTPTPVSLGNFPFSRNDPWLPAGATSTVGNNVDAYLDLVAPDGLSAGDRRAAISAPGEFVYGYDVDADPAANTDQQSTALVQAFYVSNFLHDWFYDAGFNEAAGNAQNNNYGRGGAGGDPLHVEIQDYDGRNNANMTVFSDGSSPRMQIYRFDGPTRSELTVNSPASVAGQYATGYASFGPNNFTTAGDLVLAEDGIAGDGGSSHDACEPLTNASALAGKIALIDRGLCFFVDKVNAAETAGAIAVVIVNNVSGGTVTMGAGDNPPAIAIPSLMVSLEDGQRLKTALAGANLNLTLSRTTAVDRDGAVDSQLIAHEWGHMMTNRLIAISGGGDSSTQANGMDEGWSDFIALLLSTRPEEPGAYAGAHAFSAYAASAFSESYYFGLRRYPYSTDMGKNPLSFRHIADGAEFPAGIPIAASGSPNSEVHNTGEIWATMLWECYVALLNSGRLSFDQAQARMKRYLVAADLATPADPTFVEARDALLAVAAATDPEDRKLFLSAFAKRGLGIGAIAPNRASSDHSGLVESFTTNQPPIANAGASQTVSGGTQVSLDGSASTDSDGQIASYHWQQTGGPDVVLDNADSAVARFSAPTVSAATVLSFRLTVTDNDGGNATASTSITVTAASTGGNTEPGGGGGGGGGAFDYDALLLLALMIRGWRQYHAQSHS